MEIREIKNKEVWDDFLSKCEEKTFLQSWNWGEFQKLMGNKIWRFGIFENDNLISVAFLYKIQARRGTFLFIPHGINIENPNSKNPKSQILKILLNELKKIAKEEKADFIRIAPILVRNEENIKIFKELNFRPAPIHMHPEVTWELDITPSEEELLAGMRKTTRYLIRQAEKNPDIEIIQSPAGGEARPNGRQNNEDIEAFNNLHQKTVGKHHFVPFSLNYFQKEFTAFQKDQQISIFLAKYQNEIISSAIILYWSGIGFYHHGASHPRFSKIPASYLLQWRVIQAAKKRGCKLYNFWGISPDEKKNPHRNPFGILRGRHPWAGLTLFKMGFGGYKKEYVKTQDFPLTKKYWLNFVVEKLRKVKRGL